MRDDQYYSNQTVLPLEALAPQSSLVTAFFSFFFFYYDRDIFHQLIVVERRIGWVLCTEKIQKPKIRIWIKDRGHLLMQTRAQITRTNTRDQWPRISKTRNECILEHLGVD